MNSLSDSLTPLLQGLLADPAAALLRHPLEWCYTFALVLSRISAVMLIGPLFGQRVVPRNMRFLIVICTALAVTPLLPASHTPALSQIPPNLLGLGVVLFNEFLLGFVLGLGLFILISSVQVAGELIDQQTGLGNMAAPGRETSSVSGRLLFLVATALLLSMDVHLEMLRATTETFETVPLGSVRITEPLVHQLRQLVGQSFVLAIQIAAPTLAMMGLVSVGLGYVNRTIPQTDTLSIGFALRVLVHLSVLLATVPVLHANLLGWMPPALEQLRNAFTAMEG